MARVRKPNEKVVAIYFNTDNELDRTVVEALDGMEKGEKQRFMREALYNAFWPPVPEEREHEPAQEVVVQTDNAEVLDGIARVEYKLDALMRRGIMPEQEGTVTMPGGVEATLEEIDPNAETPFLTGLKNNTFKPGMHLDD